MQYGVVCCRNADGDKIFLYGEIASEVHEGKKISLDRAA